MDKKDLIQALQGIITDLAQQADGHELESTIFADRGFLKLAQHYADHAAEERGYVKQCAQRILDLGGKVENQAKKASPIYEDPEEWIKYDRQVSIDGLAELKQLVEATRDDYITFDFLEKYYVDEENDLVWADQQLNLIELIGKQNWMVHLL